MSTEPKIYTRNYIDTYSTLSVSTGNTYKTRLFDRDRDVQWTSVGQATDGNGISMTAQFNTPSGAASPKTIDTIILLNHNFSDITLQSAPDGSTWTSRATPTGASNNLISISALSLAYWRILCSNTSPSNTEKKCAEFILCSLLLDPGIELDSYDVSYRQMAPEMLLADGSTHRTVIKWTEGRSAKYDFSGRMSYLTFTQLEALRSLKESGAAFYWQPESITRPQEIYYVNWTGPFRFKYVSSYKGAGFQVDFQFKEI